MTQTDINYLVHTCLIGPQVFLSCTRFDCPTMLLPGPDSVVGYVLDCNQRTASSNRSGHTSFGRFFHAIISTAIPSLPLIQVGQLSVTGDSMDTQYW